jgi:predicted dienelactone hydrolase
MKQYLRFILLIGLLLSLASPLAAQEEIPLAERGSYQVGGRMLTFVDEQRDGRQVQVWLWYPAVVPEDRQEDLRTAELNQMPVRDVAPDMSGAPYPVVLYSYWYRGYPGEFNETFEPLVSRGYVVANLVHRNDASALTYIDRPMDILFTINQLAALNEEASGEFTGVMNTDMVGVMGADDGADAALLLTGARLDPATIPQFEEEAGGADIMREYYYDWDWEAMTAYHDRFLPPQAGEALWPPMTDPRIRAVVAFDTYEGGVLLGERGLASATVPTLLIGQTQWGLYEGTAVAYRYSGSPERYLVSLLGSGEGGIPIFPEAAVVQQYVTAFFGYYLEGKTEYAEYLTEEYAESLDNVVWGIDESAINNPRFLSEMTFTEGDTIAVGDTIAGEIAEPGTRMGYSLTLDAPATLNLYVNATRFSLFDSVLYVCDVQGDVLFWNDELSFEDGDDFGAGLEGLELPPGSFTLIVSGFSQNTGPYELVVASAE